MQVEVRQFCELDDPGKQLRWAAIKQMNMSARAFHRILKLARTIAALAESEKIETHHRDLHPESKGNFRMTEGHRQNAVSR